MRWLTDLRHSRVTLAIVLACFVVWVGQLVSPDFSNLLPLLPSDLPDYPWTLLTAMFAHADTLPLGIAHIGLNMWALAVLGPGLERYLGRRLFAAVYLVGGLGAAALYLVLATPPGVGPSWCQQWWNMGVLGASGAIFALFGLLFWARRGIGLSTRPLIVVVAINLAFGFLIPGIAWTEHLGGLLTGFVMGGVVARRAAGVLPDGGAGRGLASRPLLMVGLIGLGVLSVVAVKYMWLAAIGW